MSKTSSKTAKKKRKYIPNRQRARYSATYVTLYKGRRLIRYYYSGQPLKGIII